MSSDSSTTSATNPWLDASYRVLDGYIRANGALMRAFGLPDPTGDAPGAGLPGDADPAGDGQSVLDPGIEAWTVERSTDEYDDLGVGDYVRFSKPLREADVSAFAGASGDTNRLHLDDSFAERTLFEGRIVHGTLVAGTISAALARFPGFTIYLSQDLEFVDPVRIGEVVTAECEIIEDLGDDQYRLHTAVYDEDGETVIDGEAVVLINESPDV